MLGVGGWAARIEPAGSVFHLGTLKAMCFVLVHFYCSLFRLSEFEVFLLPTSGNSMGAVRVAQLGCSGAQIGCSVA